MYVFIYLFVYIFVNPHANKSSPFGVLPTIADELTSSSLGPGRSAQAWLFRVPKMQRMKSSSMRQRRAGRPKADV